MFRLKLDSKKAVEAAAMLARQSPGQRISTKRLLALLYIANRECLKRSGRPLVGGRVAAMKYGPIHADVYDLTKKKGDPEAVAEWANRFHSEGYYVVLDDDPGQNKLSRFEVRVLNEVLKKYEDEDDWDVTWQTHQFSEYGTTYQKGRVRTITLEQMIHALGLSPMATSLVRDLKEKEAMDDLFASARKPTRGEP